MQRSTSTSVNSTAAAAAASSMNNNGGANNNKMRSSLFSGGPRGGGGAGGRGGGASAAASSNSDPNSAARANYRMENEEDARRENDRAMSGLADDMTRLRREAEFLRGEVASQNELIDSVQNFMISARDGIVGSVGRLDQTMKKYGVKHTLLFAVAMCGAFFVIVYLIKGMLFGQGSAAPPPAAAAAAVAQFVTRAVGGGVGDAILAKEVGIEAPPIKLAN